MKESESKQREEVRRKTMPTRRRSADLAASLLLCTEEGRPCKCSLRLFGAPETHSPSAGDVQSLSSYVSFKGGGGEKNNSTKLQNASLETRLLSPPRPQINTASVTVWGWRRRLRWKNRPSSPSVLTSNRTHARSNLFKAADDTKIQNVRTRLT